jgi:hypothetical protein
MDNSFRLQLLRTKRELQSTINQIDNILFYNNVVPQSRPGTEASRQLFDGLVNILGNRNFSSSINTAPARQTNNRYTPYNHVVSTSPSSIPIISTSPSSIPVVSTSSFGYPSVRNSSSMPNISTSSIYNPHSVVNTAQLLNTTNRNPLFGEIIPDLVEVTLYTQGNMQNNIEDVNVTPNITVLTSSSSIHIYNTLETEFESCSICIENFNSNSIVRKINNCSHIFHVDCIDTWFETNITCPVCRNDLREDHNN